jgi:hypothetical protein
MESARLNPTLLGKPAYRVLALGLSVRLAPHPKRNSRIAAMWLAVRAGLSNKNPIYDHQIPSCANKLAQISALNDLPADNGILPSRAYPYLTCILKIARRGKQLRDGSFRQEQRVILTR